VICVPVYHENRRQTAHNSSYRWELSQHVQPRLFYDKMALHDAAVASPRVDGTAKNPPH